MRFSWRTSGFPPFVRRECMHGERVDLFTHALAERRIHELVALNAAPAGELLGDDERLEVLSVADYLQVLAGDSALYALLHAFRGHHLSVPQLVARAQERQTGERYGNQACADHREARRGRHVGKAEEAVAE